MGSEESEREPAPAFSYLLDEALRPGEQEAEEINGLAERVRKVMGSVPAAPTDEPSSGGRANQLPGPFSTAVYGAWGSGKTSFLRALDEEFSSEKGGSVTVWFEPWRYEREEHLLLPLLVEFHARIHKEKLGDDVKRAALNTAKKLVGRVAKGALRSAGKLVERHVGLDPYEIGEEFFKQYGEQQRDWSTALSEVEEFRRDFATLVKIASKSSNKDDPKPVVVLVDDLDRCSPEQVRRLLESIKLFLHVQGVFFFLALDEEQVLQAMADPYRERYRNEDAAQELSKALAKRYLEKFFQLTIDVGESSAWFKGNAESLRTNIWKSVSENIKKSENGTSQVGSEIEELERVFNSIKLNPRALKRAARWLHFEYALGAPSSSILARFAEQVLALNWELAWVNDLLGKAPDARRQCYVQCRKLFSYAGFDEDSDFEHEQVEEHLIRLQTGLKYVLAGPDEIPEQPILDPEEQERIRQEIKKAPAVNNGTDASSTEGQGREDLHGPANTDEPGRTVPPSQDADDAVLPPAITAVVLGNYPMLVDLILKLVTRRTTSELRKLFAVLSSASKSAESG